MVLRANTFKFKVYGLVFASYTRRHGEPDRGGLFRTCPGQGGRTRALCHDLLKPYLRPAYEDQRVTEFGEEWRVSFRGALWRTKELGAEA